jgi:two-component system chemotaxis sensor kinase CheA
MLVLREGPLPLKAAADVFGHDDAEPAEDTHIVIVHSQDRSVALTVSRLIGQRELVTRPLPAGVADRAAVSGAAVLSDGSIVLLADCDALTTSTPAAGSLAAVA